MSSSPDEGATWSCETHSDELGPLGIDYTHWYYCEWRGMEALSWICLVLWTIALIYLLGNTASSYFSPTLGHICEKLSLPYNIAGVTFLAFGNGSPDIFSSLTAFSVPGTDVSIGVSALLGGSMFVCSVVVGAVAIVAPVTLDREVFLRDIGCHVGAVTALCIILLLPSVSLLGAIILLLLYAGYVALVMVTWQQQEAAKEAERARERSNRGSKGRGRGRGSLVGSDEAAYANIVMQTAFWFPSASSSGGRSAGGLGSGSAGGVSRDSDDLEMQAMSSLAAMGAPGGYTFITLNEHAQASSSISSTSGRNGRTRRGGGDDDDDANNSDHDGDHDEDDDEDDDEEGGTITINLTGAALDGASSGGGFVIQDDYFGGNGGGAGAGGGGDSSNNSSSSSGEAGQLKQPLLSSSERSYSGTSESSGGDSHSSSSRGGKGGKHAHLKKPGNGSKPPRSHRAGPRNLRAVDATPEDAVAGAGRAASRLVYWSAVQLRRRLQHRVTDILSPEFWRGGGRRQSLWNEDLGTILVTLAHQAAVLLEYPALLARDITIPTSDPELWSKAHAVAQPVAGPIFLMLVTGCAAAGSGAWWIVVLSSVAMAGAVYLLTHQSKPPVGAMFSVVWVLFGFVMCVVWIYALAGELVSCLSAVGTISGISPAVLGLTVLAWGNSVGDLFSNIAVARQGLGELAIAGCYGGPIFNLLIGLGMSLLYVTSKQYPKAYTLPPDPAALLSLFFLYVSLLCTIFYAVRMSDFRLDRPIGIFLVALYAVYTVAQLAMAM